MTEKPAPLDRASYSRADYLTLDIFQKPRRDALVACHAEFAALIDKLEADGFPGRDLEIARQHLQTAFLWARKAANL